MFARSRLQSASIPAPDAGAARPDVLANTPTLLLGLICLLAIAFVGWAATTNLLQVAAGVALWVLFLLRRRIGALVQRLMTGRALPPQGEAKSIFEMQRAAAPARAVDPMASFIGPDLVMAGRLSGARRVELYGSLSGEVQCDAIRVHAGAELRAHVLYDSLEIVPGATFEGAASPHQAQARPEPARIAPSPAPPSARLRSRRPRGRSPVPAPASPSASSAL